MASTPAIPPFGPSGALPPFVGHPAENASRSPYRATPLELVERFASNTTRVAILKGYLNYRAALHGIGITVGIQWIDGSFVQDKPHPGDIDLLTVAEVSAVPRDVLQANRGLFDPTPTRANYGCDAYTVDLGNAAVWDLPDLFAYWYALFSHARDTFEWKGFLVVSLDPDADAIAAAKLTQIETTLS